MVNIILKYLEQPLKAYMPYLDVVDSPVIRLASGKIYKGSGSEKQEVCISDSVGNALYVRQTQPETFRELKALSSCNKQYQVNARCRALFYTFGTNDFKVSEDKVKSGLQAALNKINFNQYTGTSTDIVITINSASFDAEKLFKDETGVDFSGNEWPIIVAVDFTLSYNDVNCNSCDIEDIENPLVWVPDLEPQNCENKAVCDVVAACPVITTLQNETASLQEQINNLAAGFSCEDLPNCQTIIDIQAELNDINGDLLLKEDVSNKVINFNSPDNTTYPTTQATKNLVDYYIQSNIKIIGDWDASSGSYPLADESNTTPFIAQWGPTIKVGWAFRVGYGQAGTVDGYDYENGDVVYALVDSPADASADWGDLDHNLQQATESVRGTSKIASDVITQAGTDDEKYITPLKLENYKTAILTPIISNKLPIAVPQTTGVALTFVTDSVYGTIGTPETGNITYSSTGAQLGVTNLIIHNHSVAPTFGANMKKLSGSGSYTINLVNYIFITYINATEVIYSINQRT